MEQIESANEKTGGETGNRNAQENEQDPEVAPRFMCLGQQIETQTHQRDRNRDQRDQADKTIEHDREQCARFMIGGFLQQQVALNNIAAGATWQELVVKHSN